MEDLINKDNKTLKAASAVNKMRIASIFKKVNINPWIIFIVILLTVMSGGVSIFYFLNIKQNFIFETNMPQQIIKPSTFALPTSSSAIKSKQIRIGTLLLTIPDIWTPIFTPRSTAHFIIYFADTWHEINFLTNCVNKNLCMDYSLKLEYYFDNNSVRKDQTIENYIQLEESDIKLKSLHKAKIDNHEAWFGYINLEKTKYQLVIDTSTAQSKSFALITASTAKSLSGMLDEYVSKLSMIKIADEYKSQPAKDLKPKKGFIVELSSSLDPKTSGSSLLDGLFEILLPPAHENNDYFLYTALTKTADGDITGSEYPHANMLNGKYYLLTDNYHLVDGVYGTSQIQIKLSTSTIKNLTSYLADPKYCMQDSDCGYRANICTFGAYNSYHRYFFPWGCSVADYENLEFNEVVREKAICGSDIDIEYDSLQCVSNSCQTINEKVVCK